MFRRNQKSQGVIGQFFFLLFGLALAAIFVLSVLGKVKAASEDTTYHRRFFSRDLALIVDSLHAADGDFNDLNIHELFKSFSYVLTCATIPLIVVYILKEFIIKIFWKRNGSNR